MYHCQKCSSSSLQALDDLTQLVCDLSSRELVSKLAWFIASSTTFRKRIVIPPHAQTFKKLIWQGLHHPLDGGLCALLILRYGFMLHGRMLLAKPDSKVEVWQEARQMIDSRPQTRSLADGP